MRPLRSFASLQAAAQNLLCDAVSIVEPITTKFTVIGGWSPFLLNSGTIQHPGSRDVDLLFEDGTKPGELLPVINALLDAGYMLSAKHSFQVLRVLKVGSEKFVFNVDLLHSGESGKKPELFADHVSLPIKLSDFSDDVVPIRSINVPVSRFIFDGHVLRQSVAFAGLWDDMSTTTIQIPLMDELGTVVTKAESMSNAKRTRDAFDIMLAMVQSRSTDNLVNGMRGLRAHYFDAFSELSKIWRIIDSSNLRDNISIYWPGAKDDNLWRCACARIEDILERSEVPRLQASKPTR